MMNLVDLGAVPDGVTDNTAIIQAALDSGAEELELSGGDCFVTGPLSIPATCRAIHGYGAFRLKDGIDAPLLTAPESITLDGFTMTGGSETPKWGNDVMAPPSSRSGLALGMQKNTVVRGLRISGFTAYGIRTIESGPTAGQFGANVALSDVSVENCFAGVDFAPNGFGEYVTATGLRIAHNTFGARIRAGNVTINSSIFTLNRHNVYLKSDYANNGHGSMTGCLCNHAAQNALWADGITNGFNFSGCCFFVGSMLVLNSTGVLVAGGSISLGGLVFGGGGNNFITRNFMVPNAASGLNNTVVDNYLGNPSAAVFQGNWTATGWFPRNNLN